MRYCRFCASLRHLAGSAASDLPIPEITDVKA